MKISFDLQKSINTTKWDHEIYMKKALDLHEKSICSLQKSMRYIKRDWKISMLRAWDLNEVSMRSTLTDH